MTPNGSIPHEDNGLTRRSGVRYWVCGRPSEGARRRKCTDDQPAGATGSQKWHHGSDGLSEVNGLQIFRTGVRHPWSPKQVVSDSSSQIEPMRCPARRNINVTHHIADKMTLSYLLPVFRKSFEKRVGRRKTSVDHHLDTGTCMLFGARHPKDFHRPSIAHPTAW